MKTYFCPRCGGRFEGSECIEDGSLLRCPQCGNPRVLLSGRILTALGVIIAVFSTMVIQPLVFVLGVVIGGGLCITGLVRSIRQRRAGRSELDESDLDVHTEDDFDDSQY